MRLGDADPGQLPAIQALVQRAGRLASCFAAVGRGADARAESGRGRPSFRGAAPRLTAFRGKIVHLAGRLGRCAKTRPQPGEKTVNML